MAIASGAKAKILVWGQRIAENRVGTALRLDEVDFSEKQLRVAGRQTLLTLSMVTGVTAVLYAVNEFVDLRHEIVFYFVPIMVAMLRWNVLQGLVAAAAAMFFANLFFYDAILTYYFNNPKRIIGLSVFAVALVIMGYLASNLRHARRASSVPLVPLRAVPQPESLVERRTSDLASAGRTPTVPERVRNFLIGQEGQMYCDSCIQGNLGLKWRQQVQLITATLGVTGEFHRDLVRCCGCDEVKQATQAVAMRSQQQRAAG
jgi:hypothetical protein